MWYKPSDVRIARVSLDASGEGRPLHESLGFASTNEMRLGRRLNR